MLDDISVCHMQHDMLLLRIIIFGMCYACLCWVRNKSNCIYYVVIQPVVLTNVAWYRWIVSVGLPVPNHMIMKFNKSFKR